LFCFSGIFRYATDATFTVKDTIPPQLKESPQDLIVQDDGSGNRESFDAWLATNGGATAFVPQSVNGFAARTDAENVTWSAPRQVADQGRAADCQISITYEFTAVDSCGNTATIVATFTIIDTIPPYFRVPPQNVMVARTDPTESLLAGWLEHYAGAEAEDKAAVAGQYTAYQFDGTIPPSPPPPVSWVYNEAVGAADPLVITCAQATLYDFTVSDTCGNALTIRGGFYVMEGFGPILDRQAQNREATIAAGAGNALTELQTWIESHGGASVTSVNDAGNPLPVTWGSEYTGTFDGCVLEIVFTWSASDQCNRLASTTATFRITDTTSPRMTQDPSNPAFEDDGTGNIPDLAQWVSRNGDALAEDDFGEREIDSVLASLNRDNIQYTGQYAAGPTVAWSSEALSIEEASKCSVTLPFQFTATDSCGNTHSVVGTTVIMDTTAPLVETPPQDLTVYTGGPHNQQALTAWLLGNGGMVAQDKSHPRRNQDEQSLSRVARESFGEAKAATPCRNQTEYDFTVTDACGNYVSQSASYVVALPAQLDSNPQDYTVESDGHGNGAQFQAWLQSYGGATLGRRGSIAWSYDFDPPTYGGPSRTTVKFTAEDNCGNVIHAYATFCIQDSIPPTLVAPASSLTVEVDGQGNIQQLTEWLNSNGGAHAYDNIGGLVWTHSYVQYVPTDTSDSCPDRSTTVTFQATDWGGNYVQTTATFSIEDTTPPNFITPPADAEIASSANGLQIFQHWMDTFGGAVIYDVGTDPSYCNLLINGAPYGYDNGVTTPPPQAAPTTPPPTMSAACNFCGYFSMPVCTLDGLHE
jgi:hypothetical protein